MRSLSHCEILLSISHAFSSVSYNCLIIEIFSDQDEKNYDQPRRHIKKQRRDFANKGPSSQGYGFSSSHV